MSWNKQLDITAQFEYVQYLCLLIWFFANSDPSSSTLIELEGWRLAYSPRELATVSFQIAVQATSGVLNLIHKGPVWVQVFILITQEPYLIPPV